MKTLVGEKGQKVKFGSLRLETMKEEGELIKISRSKILPGNCGQYSISYFGSQFVQSDKKLDYTIMKPKR